MSTKTNQDLDATCVCLVDHELEAVNAKIRANIFKTTLRNDGETVMEHYRRLCALVYAQAKKRNAYGQIV
jgi:hypothetical protein